MGLFERFPYTNFHDLNLDWILLKIKENEKAISDFIGVNTIKYADPILWDITAQYEANTVVIDPQNGNAFISVQAVPYGVSLSDSDYWGQIYNYANELSKLREQIAAVDEGAGTTASQAMAIGALAWLNGSLYRVTAPMIPGDSYVEGSNCVKTTIEEEIERARQYALSLTGDLLNLGTSDKTNLVAAINEVLANEGVLTYLNTTVKTDLVSAINEVLATIGLVSGDLATLSTTDKSNLVAAINEVLATLNTATGDLATLSTADKTNLVAAINEIYSELVNLQNDLLQIATATAEQYGASGSVNVYNVSLSLGDTDFTLATDYETGNDFIIPGGGDLCSFSAPLTLTATATTPGSTHTYSIAAMDRFGGHSVYTSVTVSATIDAANPVTLNFTPAGTPFAYVLIRDGAVIAFINGAATQYIDGGAINISNLPVGFVNTNAVTRGFSRHTVTGKVGDTVTFTPAAGITYSGAIYHDDTRAIQLALDAGNLTFGKSSYNIANVDRGFGYPAIFEVYSDRIVDGGTATLYNLSNQIAEPVFMNSENISGGGTDHDITIRNITYDGGLDSTIYTERNANAFNIGGAIYMAMNGGTNPFNIAIENCTIKNTLAGITFANIERFRISGIIVENTSRDGILIADGCIDGIVSNCNIFQTGDDGIGVSGAGQYNITVSNNTIRNSGSRCINVQGNFISVTGNTCAGSAWSAIEPNCNYPGSVCQNVVISGNTVYDAGNYTGGINGWYTSLKKFDVKVYDRGDGSPASNIIITDNLLADANPFGIIGNNPTPVNTIVFKNNNLTYGALYDFSGLYDIIFTDCYNYHNEESVTITTPGAAVTLPVTFRTPLPAVPVVMLSPSWGTNTSYLNAYATNITTTGFDLVVNAGVADTFKVVWTATV